MHSWGMGLQHGHFTLRTPTRKQRMPIQQLQLFDLTQGGFGLENQLPIVITGSQGFPLFDGLSIWIRFKIRIVIPLHSIGMHSTDQVWIMGVELTAIAFWNLNHTGLDL